MIDCVTFVKDRKEKLKKYIEKNNLHNIKLAVIQIGSNPASNSYSKGKLKDCEEVGIKCEHLKFDEDSRLSSILSIIDKSNKDDNVKGIIVQLPLPKEFHPYQGLITDAICKEKDVDGFKPDSDFTPCTPKGIMALLNDGIQYDVCGKVCCVIGKSEIVGKPMVNLLQNQGATVISCNSKTKDLKKWVSQSDVVVSAVGRRNLVTLDMINRNQVIIDVGINRDDNGHLCGDCDKEIYNFVDAITPVPKGVGLLTRLSLLENTIYGV